MPAKEYRSIETVTAIRWIGESIAEVEAFLGPGWRAHTSTDCIVARYSSSAMKDFQATIGEWIVRSERHGVFTETDSAFRAKFPHQVTPADDLLTAAKAALGHLIELREAWRTGALSENDTHSGTRSNRNVEVEVALRNAIAAREGKGA